MKFVYPIEKKSAVEHYKLNREGYGGYYPIGLNNSYHGGIHLDGKHPIVAIAEEYQEPPSKKEKKKDQNGQHILQQR